MLDHAASLALVQDAGSYLEQALGAGLTRIRALGGGALPMFIADRYELFEAHFLGQPCLLAVARDDRDLTASSWAKHRQTIEDSTGIPIQVLLSSHVDSRTARSFITHGLPFIVPGSQLYLPDFAIHLKRQRTPPKTPSETLSPTAQLIVLGYLHGHPIEGETASSLAPRYDLSVMTLARALAELQERRLIELHPHGRRNIIGTPLKGRACWDKALPFLRSPVRKRRIVEKASLGPAGRLAGESALADYTSLIEPEGVTFAIADHAWKWLRPELGPELDRGPDAGAMVVETWSYDPQLLSPARTVDRLSLWLAMHDHPDERVAKAADDVLQAFAF